MAAAIRTNGEAEGEARPVLTARVTGFRDRINAALLLRKEDGVLTICDDKSVRVWLKRDSGQYWPSIHHLLPAVASCMDLSEETGRLFLGLDSGAVAEVILADDLNSLRTGKEFLSHTGPVTAVRWCADWEWVLSVGKDKALVWECSETGRRLGSFALSGAGTSLQFDAGGKMAFVGDATGSVTVLKLSDTTAERITSLTAHNGAIRSLAWDVERSQLYSGSNDSLVVCWDIGGRQGRALELTGHKRRVTAVAYWPTRKALLSASDGGRLMVWDMGATRKETATWATSDSCQRCDAPFFWNLRACWERRVVGARQHHCRLCGLAVCAACSPSTIAYPPMGFELAVRVCGDCATKEVDEEVKGIKVEEEGSEGAGSSSSSASPLKPLASGHDVGHSVLGSDLDPLQGRLLTYGTDRVIKIWDVSALFSKP